jgi:hypothetical protein
VQRPFTTRREISGSSVLPLVSPPTFPLAHGDSEFENQPQLRPATFLQSVGRFYPRLPNRFSTYGLSLFVGRFRASVLGDDRRRRPPTRVGKLLGGLAEKSHTERPSPPVGRFHFDIIDDSMFKTPVSIQLFDLPWFVGHPGLAKTQDTLTLPTSVDSRATHDLTAYVSARWVGLTQLKDVACRV